MKKIFTFATACLFALASYADKEVTTGDVTDGTSYYALFSADEALDFSAVEGVKAYVAEKVYADRELPNGHVVQELTEVKLTEVSQVPAHTGVIVCTAAAGTYSIPTASGEVEVVAKNDLVAVDERADAAWVAFDEEEEIYDLPFVLAEKNGVFGFVPIADYNSFDEETGWLVENTFFVEPGTAYMPMDYSLATPNTVVPISFAIANSFKEVTTADVTDGTSYYALFSADEALDFSAVEGVKAFVAQKVYTDRELPNGHVVQELTEVKLTEVSQVPAHTGVIVCTAAAGTYSIPTASGEVEVVAKNDLVAVDERADAAWVAFDEEEEIYDLPFVLAEKNGVFGFVPIADYNSFDEETGWLVENTFFVEPGTAYMPMDYSLATPNTVVPISFGTEDGIQTAVQIRNTSNVVYDLQGRRVSKADAQMRKGIYINEGKKILVK